MHTTQIKYMAAKEDVRVSTCRRDSLMQPYQDLLDGDDDALDLYTDLAIVAESMLDLPAKRAALKVAESTMIKWVQDALKRHPFYNAEVDALMTKVLNPSQHVHINARSQVIDLALRFSGI